MAVVPLFCAGTPIGRSELAKVPVIDSTKTTGLVFVPGAMTGMIPAGAGPLQAVRLQVVVVFMLLAAVSLTATIVSRPSPAACSLRHIGGGGKRPEKEERRGAPSAPRPSRHHCPMRSLSSGGSPATYSGLASP